MIDYQFFILKKFDEFDVFSILLIRFILSLNSLQSKFYFYFFLFSIFYIFFSLKLCIIQIIFYIYYFIIVKGLFVEIVLFFIVVFAEIACIFASRNTSNLIAWLYRFLNFNLIVSILTYHNLNFLYEKSNTNVQNVQNLHNLRNFCNVNIANFRHRTIYV